MAIEKGLPGARHQVNWSEATESMTYGIVKLGDAVLEKKAAPITNFDEELKKLVEDMFESMYAAHGIGLAAPQIGISTRLAVIDIRFKEDPAQKLVIANPEIIHKEGKQRESEGCLSIPEFRENVTRSRKVKVRAQDINGNWFETEGEGLLARALQHEIDHLDGRLYIRHLSGLKRDLILRKVKKLQKAGEWK